MTRLRLLGVAWLLTAGCGLRGSPELSAALQPPRPQDLLPETARAQAPERETPPNYVQPAGYNRNPTAPEDGKAQGGVAAARVVVRVNGQPILMEEVRNAASAMLMDMQKKAPPEQWMSLSQQIINGHLQNLINQELLIQDAEKRVPKKQIDKVNEMADKEFESDLRKKKADAGIKSDEEFRQTLLSQGLSLDQMRRQNQRSHLSQEYLRNLIADKIKNISRQDMLNYYEQNPKEFDRREQVSWQYLFISATHCPTLTGTQQYAKQVHAKALAAQVNDDFDALALSDSDNPSKDYRKADLKTTERGAVIQPPELEKTVFQLLPGQVSPLIETQNGFYIVRVVEHQPGGRVPFDKACREIENKLRNKIYQEEMARIIDELRSKAFIQMDPK